MTKKDYELFANEIHGYIEREKLNPSIKVNGSVFNSQVDLVANVFEKDNPLFDRAKFERACYEGKHIRKSVLKKVQS